MINSCSGSPGLSLAVQQQSPIGGFVPPGIFGNGESHPHVSFVTHALLVPALDHDHPDLCLSNSEEGMSHSCECKQVSGSRHSPLGANYTDLPFSLVPRM